MNMPESIASLFQHQSQMESASKSESGGSDGQKQKAGIKAERPASDPAIPQPPSPITIPRAQISNGNVPPLDTVSVTNTLICQT